MAIGTPIVSLGNLGHPDGGDSPKVFVLLAFTSPGVGFDLDKASRDLGSQGPRTEAVQLFNLPRAFTSQDSYHLQVGLHEQGWPHIRLCCLNILPCTRPSQEGHCCLPHQKAEVGPLQSIKNRHVHGIINNLKELEDTLTHDSNLHHDWDLLAYSGRWSGTNNSARSNQGPMSFSHSSFQMSTSIR